MSLLLAAPWALWGLLALALPVLLHLRPRHPKPRTLDFAALACVPMQTRPRRRLRLRELPLLLLRCALLATVALALAQPSLIGWSRSAAVVLVHPALQPAGLGLDPASDARWLAEGFPALDQPRPAAPDALASLLRGFDAQLDADVSLGVHLPGTLDGLDGERLRLSRAVEWQVHPVEVTPTPAPIAREPLRVAFGGEARTPASAARFAALRQAWTEAAGDRIRLQAAAAAPTADPVDTLLWLGDADLPQGWQDWLAQGGRVLVIASSSSPEASVALWRGQAATLRADRLGRGERRMLDCALEPACLPELFEPEFPARVLDWLAPEAPVPRQARAVDVAPEAGAEAPHPPGEPLSHWLALLAALLFLAERALAARRPA